MKRQNVSPTPISNEPLFKRRFEKPDFVALLKKPLLDLDLPTGFSVDDESKHLSGLWDSIQQLGNYRYEAFVHAGGSGMVFKVLDEGENAWALKIVRKKVYELKDTSGEVATALSPVSEGELRALQKLSHPNVVRLREALEDHKGVVAICTTYVENPTGLDHYLRKTLAKHPDPKGTKGIHPFSPQRLDNACAFLAERCLEIASAIKHMHDKKIFHFDIKPANILLSSSAPDHKAALTDMGSCIHAEAIEGLENVRVHFTWTYAHPELTTIVSNPQSISGGGLKASAKIDPKTNLARFDLFALGKTIQEALAIIENEFHERCHASYGFRFLHLVACLLLDGRNAPSRNEPRRSKIVEKDGRRFVTDVALDYPPELFELHKINSADEVVERLQRFSRRYSWNQIAPEFDHWQPELINSVAHSPAPFTSRVAAIFNHTCLRRLKLVDHLGWMREVYPGATHDRWAHSLGVFSALVSYYNSLLSDPAVPTFRILVDGADISHAFLAAMIHDLGQTTFGHDLEEACPQLFAHEKMLSRMLSDEYFGKPTLKETIEKHWQGVDIPRLLTILKQGWEETEPQKSAQPKHPTRAVDGVASDVISGPIDADKLDYLLRDSICCGVPYGNGIDVQRFLQALTISASNSSAGGCRLELAYKAKGRPAVESLLIARYQMYGAVYWHHTFRSILAMFVHSAASTFGQLGTSTLKLRDRSVNLSTIQELLYQRVICGKSWTECARAVPRITFEEAPSYIAVEPVLDLVWQFASDPIRNLLTRLAKRELYKRIYEMRVGELGPRADYSALKAELAPFDRVAKAQLLQKRLLDKVLNEMREHGSKVTAAESAAKKRHEELMKCEMPILLLDFPTRGIPNELNLPREIGDPERKYFTLPAGAEAPDDNVFHVVRRLQERMATVRVYAAPEFHELIIRYLNSVQIQECVESVIERLRTR